MTKKVVNPPLTKERFLGLLRKASKPISEWQSEKEVKQTSESHLSDDCTDKCTSQGKTGDKED